ncbi:MAG: class I SAM-dependent methyltransferase [Deltaproteobacteria bacterium]|nr:class I SAM-dependent methyltransferase [Deltaproteobacteria bacterium]
MRRGDGSSAEQFFRSFWPAVGPAVTGLYARTPVETRFLIRVLGLRRGDRVLDVPCGFGRHSLELARRGIRALGVDLNPRFIAEACGRARLEGVPAEFRVGDMRRLRLRAGFDAAINLFSSLGYYGEATDQAFLGALCRALRPGGRVLLQVVNRDFIIHHLAPRMRYQAGPVRVREVRSFDLATSVVTTRWEASRGQRRWTGTLGLRVYAYHELVRMLEQTGLRVTGAWADFDRRPAVLGSRWFVLRGERARR